jgi:hypothetical protein
MRILAVAFVFLFAAAAHAGPAIKTFHNKQAIQKVINEQSIMNRIANLQLDSEVTGITSSYTGNGPNKNYIVRITMTEDKLDGPRICYTDVAVNTVFKTATKADGSKMEFNELEVDHNLPEAVCNK